MHADIFCTVFVCLALEEISIINFHEMEITDRANSKNINFAFEVDTAIQYEDTLTYGIELYWEEEVSGRSGRRLSSYYIYLPSQPGYITSCKEHGSFSSSGQMYQFSVSKQGLGSGPLYVNLSVSLICMLPYNNSMHSYEYDHFYHCFRCPHWKFSGQSNTIKIPSIHGMYIRYVCIIIMVMCFPYI